MILLAIFATSIAISSPHSTSPAAIPEPRSDERQYENQNPSSSKNAFLNWCDKYEVVITLSAAIAVAVFTGLLTLFTVKLWQSGEKHSERELRAYLSITPGRVLIDKDKSQIRGAVCVVKNHGRTPAFEINFLFGISVLPIGAELPATTGKIKENMAIFPEAHLFPNFWAHPFTSEETAKVMEGKTHRLHIWGQATYRDAFGKRRITRFSASLGGKNFTDNFHAVQQGKPLLPKFSWTFEDRHNDAT